MIRIVTCVTVICDRCNESAGEQDDDAIGELHFACLDEAAKHLPRWHLDPAHGHAVCPGCGADEECATYGHDLDQWRDCACRGRSSAHRAAMTVEAILTSTCPLRVRRCQRCHRHSEVDPALPKTAEVEPEPPTTTTVDLDEFSAALVDGELAPAGAVTAALTPEQRVAVTVELPADDLHKARWLTNWLDVLTDPIAITADWDDANNDLLVLSISGSLHGFFDHDGRATITVPFSATGEPAEVAIIVAATAGHKHTGDHTGDCWQDLTALVDQLAALTTGEA